MATKNCKIIAIEGIDGSGKGLQYDMLWAKLKEEGKKYFTLSFPTYDSFFGKEIGNMLSGNSFARADVLDPKSMALWYAMDRFKSFENLVCGEYDYILLNRYILSNAVYQSIRVPKGQQKDFVNWVFELENKILGLPEPHMNFIMDIDDATSVTNVKAKGYREYTGNQPDVYEKSKDIMQQARNSYLEFSKQLSNTFVINCMEGDKMKKPQIIHDEILKALEAKGLYDVKN